MSVISYLDFDLSIEAADPEQIRYRARVLNSPAGQASILFEQPFSALELENFLLRVGRPRRGVRTLGSPEMQAAQAFGSRLFTTVFTGQIQTCLQRSLDMARQQNQGVRIRLRLSDAPVLADLPWEFLYDAVHRRFLVHSTTTLLVRYLDLPQTSAPLTVQPPLKVLVMIANPRDQGYSLLDVENEWHKVQNALAGLEGHGLVEVTRLEDATLNALQHQLRRNQYHIFHFVGHGGFDQQTQNGVLLMEDEQGRSRLVSGHYLGALLHDHFSLRLVLLNACEGARATHTDPFAGVAQYLMQQGIPAVIAMQFEITDQAAITLSHEFYTALADNYGVDAALAEARKALYAVGNDIEWGTPVLYLRAQNGQLFDLASLDTKLITSGKSAKSNDQEMDAEYSYSKLPHEIIFELRRNGLYGLLLAVIIVVLDRYFLPATNTSTITAAGSFIIATGILLAQSTLKQPAGQRYKLLVAGGILYIFIGIIAGAFLFSEERTGILILDVSEHMKGQFNEVVSYVEATRFPDELDYIGMVTFGGGLSFTIGCNDLATQVKPTSRNDGVSSVEQRLKELIDAEPAGPETIQTAVSKTIELLAGRRGYHTLVLVTSGTLENSCDPLAREYLNDRARMLGVDFDLTIITVASPSDDNKRRLEGFANGQVATVPIAELPRTIESAFTRPRFSPYDFLYQLGVQDER